MRSPGRRNGGNRAHCSEQAAKDLPGVRWACLHARRMNAQREITESAPAAQHPRQRGLERRDPTARNEAAIATVDAVHSSQQLACGYGRIVVGHCVTLRDQQKTILTNEAMKKEAVVAENQHNVSGYDLAVRCALNREQIAWPYRGKHAHSPCFQANGAAAAKNLGGKTKLVILASFQCVGHGRPQNYEVCRLNLHCKIVTWTLPRDSAMVSKTRSCRNPGS